MDSNAKQKILYGAGAMGKRAFEFYTKKNPDAVYCFADTYKSDTEYCGKKVISFDDFLKMHKNYDTIICVFNLRSLVVEFKKNGVYDFSVWDDILSPMTREEKIAPFKTYTKSIHDSDADSRKKILYGAGYYGKLATDYYGTDQVFAFADINRFGEELFDKPILHPSELYALQSQYEIVVCVEYYSDVLSYFKEHNISDFRIFALLTDIRISEGYKNSTVNPFVKDTITDSKIISEMTVLDTIESPDLIYNYRDCYLRELSRRYAGGLGSVKATFNAAFLGENLLYGYFDSVKNYADKQYIDFFEAPAITHGYCFYDYTKFFRVSWQNIMGNSTYWRHSYHTNLKDTLYFSMGSYFHYVTPFYDTKKFDECKRRLGKNLTVFPFHTSQGFISDYNETEFADVILKDAESFDSLTVCVFFADLLNGNNEPTIKLARLLESHGANIVSAGYSSDPSFVRRLKTIISLADAVLTNGLSSHVWHSMSMSRPVKLYWQKTNPYHLTLNNEVLDKYHESRDNIYQKMFSVENYQITEEQLKMCERIICPSETKTKEEMGAILDLSKRIIQNCDYKTEKYIDSIRQTYRSLQQAATPYEKLQFRLMQDALPADYESHLRNLGVQHNP